MLDALLRYHDHPWAPFHTPGHKHGRAADPDALRLLGEGAFARDLTELDETDSLHAPEGVIAEAQVLAARAFGADQTHFLVNGSTGGIHAMVMAAVAPGEAIALSRASHLSVLGAVVLAGARPVFAGASWDADWQLPLPPSTAALEAAFEAQAGLRAVLVTRPDYFGRAVSLSPYAEACRRHDRLLLVDEAHGAHLGLDPRLPASALAQGADAAVQSTHKLLSGLTQASMLHLKGDRLASARVRKMLRLLQTTSPSYLLMASLDAARRHRQTRGAAEWQEAIALIDEARERLDRHGVPCLGPGHGPAGEWDPAKLIVDLSGTGHDGYGVADHLHDFFHVQVELATPRYLGALAGPGNTREELDRLVDGILSALFLPAQKAGAFPEVPPDPELVVLPRDAHLGPSRGVPFAQAEGEIAAEWVCPYPPGVPALIPGERITRQVLEYLNALRALGAEFVGPEAPDLETLQVCAPRTALTPC
ncbi:MAG TPA: aminotransferase class I/II-fold pyridoxal phosphate-dependent enzyme [Pantanalinema sp.]